MTGQYIWVNEKKVTCVSIETWMPQWQPPSHTAAAAAAAVTVIQPWYTCISLSPHSMAGATPHNTPEIQDLLFRCLFVLYNAKLQIKKHKTKWQCSPFEKTLSTIIYKSCQNVNAYPRYIKTFLDSFLLWERLKDSERYAISFTEFFRCANCHLRKLWGHLIFA